MNPLKLLKIFGTNRIGRTDLGVLKVAFMVAALDGEVTEAEYETFGRLAKKCRGYTPKAADQALREALRSAGYLMILSKRAKDAELVKAFVSEAQEALPCGFAGFSLDEVRRAVVLWIAMGMSDGDYSPRERKSIEAIRRLFAEFRVTKVREDEERWRALANDEFSGRGAFDPSPCACVEPVGRDFVRDVESLMARFGDSADAAKALKDLIADAGPAPDMV